MKRLSATLVLFILLSTQLTAQRCFDCGEGSMGKLVFRKDTVLDAGEYDVQQFIIADGVHVQIRGNTPLIIRSREDILIKGTLDASGKAGTYSTVGIPVAGVAGPGGANGASGVLATTFTLSGNAGNGTGAGHGGSGHFGGSGAGYAFSGASSGQNTIIGGNPYSSAALSILSGGSGGGSGAASPGNPSGSGGGGGGLIILHSCENITVFAGGAILCEGGAGADARAASCGAGGGGSGGTIWLACRGFDNHGKISAKGGKGGVALLSTDNGGNGSTGRIRIDYKTVGTTGSITPAMGYNENPFIAQIFRTVDATCNNVANGYAKVRASGGTPPYIYHWSNGAGAAEQSTLHAGSYTVTITDASGCTQNEFITINEPPTLKSWTSNTPPSCTGLHDAYIAGDALGGTPFPAQRKLATVSYHYSNQSMAGMMFSLLSSQNITVNGISLVLSGPVQHHLRIWYKQGAMTGYETSSAAWIPTGVYTVQRSNEKQTEILLDNPVFLNKGTHSFYVYDENGTIEGITEESLGSTRIIQQGLTLQSGVCRGASASPFAAPTLTKGYFCGNIAYTSVHIDELQYDFDWSMAGGGRDREGVGAGDYTFTVTDANGCASKTQVNIDEPQSFTIHQLEVKNPSCKGMNNGSISLDVLDNDLNRYSVNTLMSDASVQGMMTELHVNVPISLQSISVPVTSSCTISAYLLPGDYTGKELDAAAWIHLGDFPLTATVPGQPIRFTLPSTTLSSGTWSLYLYDPSGNIRVNSPTHESPVSKSLTFSNGMVRYDAGSAFNTVAVDSAGFSGIIHYTIDGGAINYSWDNGSTTGKAINLSGGDHLVTVASPSGCQQRIAMTLTEPTAVKITTMSSSPAVDSLNNGELHIAAGGGTKPYSYFWLNTSQSGPSLTQLSPGEYPVLIVDKNGCTLYDTLSVARISTAIPAPGILVVGPSPTNNFIHVTKDIEGMDVCTFSILDATGRLIYAENTTVAKLQNEGVLLHTLRDGLYWFAVQDDNQYYVTRFTIIR